MSDAPVNPNPIEPAVAAPPPGDAPAPVSSPPPAAEPAPNSEAGGTSAPAVSGQPAPESAQPAPPPEPAAPHPAEVPTLLEGAGKKDEPKAADKPAEKAAAEGAPKAEAAPVEPAAPEPIKWDYKLPETIKASEKQLADFNGALEAIARPKEGETPSQSAQRLLDMHNQAMTDYAEQTRRDQVSAFNETRKGWQKEVLADPMIGGAGHETAMRVIARMRDLFVSDSQPGSKEYAADEKALNDFLRITGAGDHPVFLKMLYRVGAKFDEPSIPAPGAKPSPNNGRAPGRKGLYANPPPAAG